MQQVISLCLRKNPNARPSVDSIIRQLEVISGSNTSHGGIASAGAAIAREAAKGEAKLTLKQTEDEARKELAKDAIKSLDFIIRTLIETVERNAPVARNISKRGIELGNGRLTVDILFPLLPKDAFSNSKKNIICGALISVEQNNENYGGRSANLWFGEFSPGEYRWYEISYYSWAYVGASLEPFGVASQSEIEDADLAYSPITHTVQHATTPSPIDGEHTEGFINRWLNRLAQASLNRLQRPNRLPES